MSAKGFIENAQAIIRSRGLRLVLPEGEDQRIREVARILESEDLAHPLVLSTSMRAPAGDETELVLRARPRMSAAMAERLLARPLHRGGAMVATGKADAMLAGAANPTARVIEAALMTIGLAPGIATPSSFFLMQWPARRIIFADCAVNAQPSDQQLADIAIASAASARAILGEEPRIAMLSFSTHGSGRHADAEKVARATALLRERQPNLSVDGELQADAALSPEVAANKLSQPSAVAGRANVLIFPDLDAGNIAYKLLQQLGSAKPVGPVLQGFAKPVSDLSRGASVEEIVATTSLLLAMAMKHRA